METIYCPICVSKQLLTRAHVESVHKCTWGSFIKKNRDNLPGNIDEVYLKPNAGLGTSSEKQSDAQKKAKARKKQFLVETYLENPKKCNSCGLDLSYEKRFNNTCSKSCSNRLRKQSDVTKLKISKTLKGNLGVTGSVEARVKTEETTFNKLKGLGVIDATNPLKCIKCGRVFETFQGLWVHLKFYEIRNLKLEQKLNRKVVSKTGDLDITYRFLEEYRGKVKGCEICGKGNFEDQYVSNGKIIKKKLNADHCHVTNKFRGLLCTTCNTNLAWFENNEGVLQGYLSKGDFKLSESYIEREPKNILLCSICGYEAESRHGLSAHKGICHKDEYRELRKDFKVILKRNLGNGKIETELNITNRQLEEYRKTQKGCEICNKECSHELNKKDGKVTKVKLAADHDHETNKFRGLLCYLCNTYLGWYETNKVKVDEYLCKIPPGENV